MDSNDKAKALVTENLQRVAFTASQVNDAHVRVVSAQSFSSMERIPFRVATYREGLICRFVESAEAVLTVFKAKQFAATITLTQSVIMTTAALWQLYMTVDSAIRREDLRVLKMYLHQIYTGASRERSTHTFDAATVMGFIQRADHDFPMFQQNCEELLKFDRPEWFGTGHLYAGDDTGKCSVNFRRRLSRSDKPVELMSEVLKLTALAHEHFDRELERIFPKLSDLDNHQEEAVPGGLISTRAASIEGRRRPD